MKQQDSHPSLTIIQFNQISSFENNPTKQIINNTSVRVTDFTRDEMKCSVTVDKVDIISHIFICCVCDLFKVVFRQLRRVIGPKPRLFCTYLTKFFVEFVVVSVVKLYKLLSILLLSAPVWWGLSEGSSFTVSSQKGKLSEVTD